MVRAIGHIEIALVIQAHAKWLVERGQPSSSARQGGVSAAEYGFHLRAGRLHRSKRVKMAADHMAAIAAYRRFTAEIDRVRMRAYLENDGGTM